MMPTTPRPSRPYPPETGRPQSDLTRLNRSIVAILLLVSLLPLALSAIGSWVVFGRMLEERTLELHRSTVESHSTAIQLYLTERIRALELLSRCLRLDDARDPAVLGELFKAINQSYDDAFVDLGVIDSDGRHLAYVGPYRLEGKNYAGAQWFHDVLGQGTYVSDVFLGFRGIPHVVMAVKREDGRDTWILRATINSRQFDTLVRTDALGQSGDAYLVNDQGIYQTPPRKGDVLEQSPLRLPQRHRGLREQRLLQEDRAVVQMTTWLNKGRWMLVAQQDEAEIRAPINAALVWGGLVVLLSVLLVVVTVVLATRHLTDRIARANERTRAMSRDLMRSSKLASVGELATGLAHEINNPLAILSAEQTNIEDALGELDVGSSGLEEIAGSVTRSKKQIGRCGAITAKMLQFGRQGEALLQPTDIEPKIHEIVSLLGKQAEIRNIRLTAEVTPGLPSVMVDPTELEQTLVNLTNNAMQAINGSGEITISATSEGQELRLEVRDTGCGIPADDLDRLFQPFFTTKPVGEGTGLGLSVCYGMVRGWGGTIEAQSQVGGGTSMIIRLPAPARSGPGNLSREVR